MNRMMFNLMDNAPPLFVHFKREAPKGVLRKGRVGVLIHMHKRTTPKTFKRATPALVRLKPYGARVSVQKSIVAYYR